MPERRKMKSPSPKMTSTPKMKRKETEEDPESNKELQKRLGFSENLGPKKEFSTPDSVEFTEYNDGTTRPMFKRRLKSASAKTGESAQLECVVSGSPLPKVLWLKNNRPLKAADGCKVVVDEGTNTLVFPSAREEDVGIYTARAMNVNGSIMCSAEFTLTDGQGLPAQPVTDSPMDMDFTTPAYFFQMSSCEVAEGRIARFDCRVVAYPRPEIVWMRDGKVVESADRYKLLNFNNEIYSLLIQDVRIEDTGRYTCWARNKFGEAMTEAYLNVIALTEQEEEGDLAPKFLTRFYDQQTTEGTATDFRCLIAGRPEPSVTWLLDDLEIKETPGVKMRHKDGVVSLEIKSPKVDQSGQYTCQLSNPLGDATCSARLTVIEDKLRGKMLPKFLKKFDHVNAKDGEEVKFTCVIVGEPRPEVSWMFEHKPIDDANRRFVMKKEGDAYSLIIKNVRFDDTGKITCKAVNEEGEVYCSANLHVRESKYMRDTQEKLGMSQDEMDSKFGYIPTFTKRLQDVEVKEGSKAMFEVRVMGIPDPEISWMKDGRVILPDRHYHMTFENGIGQLTIDNVSPTDAGVYTCIVSNSHGKSSSTATLKLEDTTKKERYTPDKGLEERLSRKDRYSPDKHLLEELTTPKRPYLDTDRYEDEISKRLDLPEVRAPPKLPSHRPIITDLGEETVRLAWRPVETYQAKRIPPVSYRLEAKELPGKDWMPLSSQLRDTTHYLSELPLDRDYMIRVRAENDYGLSEPTEPLWLPRARVFPGVPITRPEIIDYEDTRAKLSWSRVDIPAFGLDETPLLYMLEVEEPPYKDWRTIARDLDDTEYIVEGLRPGRDYRFRVRAKTPTGIISEPSPAVSLYTKLAQSRAPVDRLEVLEYEPDTRSVQLSWDRVDIPPYNMDEEPLMYMIEYQEPPLPDWRTLVTGVPTTRYRVMHLHPERDYQFRVRALTPYGVSPPSPALPVTLRQTPVTRGLPESVIISEVEADSLRLSWRRPMYDLDRPVSYQIEMLEPPFTDWKPIATRVMDTTYKVTGLKPSRDYQFRVVPQVDTGYLEPSWSASLTTHPVRPRLPFTEPKLKELGPESVQLSWRPAEIPAYQRRHTPVYYKVEMAELPSSNWVPVAPRVTDTLYNVTGLRPDQEYKFRVFAESDSGLSEPSMPATLHRRPVPRFSFKEPTIRDISQNVVHLAWTPADLPDRTQDLFYQVEYQTPPGIGTWGTLYARHPAPSARLADLRPDLDYLVRVRAQYGTYTSEPTLPVYIPRRAAPPRLPVEEPYAVDIGSDYVKLQWRTADLPTHIQDYAPVTYRLEAQEMPDSTWVTIARGIPHTDFKVTGLNALKDYTFRIRAENDYGLSEPTRPMALRKRSVAPILPSSEPLIYDVGPGAARLTWRPASLPSYSPSQTPITYTLFVQELPFKTWRPLVKGIPHTSYYVSGLQPDKEYMFRVIAENEYGSSKPTEAVRLPRFTDYTRPVWVPEVSDFDEDLTSVKLQWKTSPRVSPAFDRTPRKYTIETWEPVLHEWKPVARGIPDTTYQIRGLPKLPDHLFRVRMETDQPTLSEPSLPVSLSRYHLPRIPMHRPQLYELEEDAVRLSWQPVSLPQGVSRRSVRYTVEQREIPETSWWPVTTDLTETSYKVRGLKPKSDYEFRVKAFYEGTATEPSYPVSLFRRPVIPTVKFDTPVVYDIDDTSLSLRWNTVDVPAFTHDEEPLLFIIERQTLPDYEWKPVATNVRDRSYTVHDLKPYQDYNFRVRGVYPSGYTEPSPYVPVYRRPIRYSVPVARTEVWEEEPSTARLRWQRAYIPRYYSTTPIKYRVEMQEAGDFEMDWRPVATNVMTPDVRVKDISPRKDYRFRIRAEMENGDLSEPTPPIQYYRSKMPMVRDALAEFKPIEYKEIFLKHPYYDILTKYVPPSMPINKPELILINQETVELSWRPAIVAEAIRGMCNLTYTVEVRCPPSFEWRELVAGLRSCNHTVSNLHPRVDYVFRVRAWNEYGSSEAGLPVSLYRRQVWEAEDDYDEEFEKEWERKYGTQDKVELLQKVPPKLPIDTPSIVTQTQESIWFSWLPARIPAYAKKANITYVIEIKESPSTAWQREAEGLCETFYVKESLDPNREYHIRVRAETEFGPSEPTMPIIIRGKGTGSRPTSRRSSMERDDLGEKIDLSYLENVMAGVPPRMPSTRPTMSRVGPDRLTLSWSSSRTPSYVRTSNITYIVEKREPPGHVWTVVAKDITGHKYEVTGLDPNRDYMFRVRAKNEFGLSDPTLPMTIYRDRDDYVPPKVRSRSSSRDSINMLVSKVMKRSSSVDYGTTHMDDDRSSEERMPVKPEYVTTTYDTQYGVMGKKGKIKLQVRGYPLPTIHWYKDEEKIQYGDQYNAFITPTGDITLEIKKIGADTLGQYKCYAENPSGAAAKVVTFELAEAPTVLETIKDVTALKGDSVTLTCKVDGFHDASVKWMKDWRPLADCTRIKIVNVGDMYFLEIINLLESDEGLYACTVENIAGKVTISGRLKVEIDSIPGFEDISIRTTPIEERYHVLEEIGRGRYGVVRRVVEISTGRTFAANFMTMRNKAQKNFFMSEFEVLRSVRQMNGVLKLYDAFETERSLILVTELLSEPELLEKIITDGNWTELKVISVIRKLLTILRELEHLKILHLDIKPSNIRLCGADLDDVKLLGFGLSRVLPDDEDITHNYGSVGYASPEQVTNDILTTTSDTWALGVLAYILLSGYGPFQGSSAVEILTMTKDCKWSFEGRGFEKFSKEGCDFISKLLVKDPSKRMTVEQCLDHPWMSCQSEAKINTDQLKQFYNAEKLHRETEKVYTTVQLQSFAKILHGAKALYQPAVDIESGEIIFPDADEYGDYLDEDAWYEWQLQYLDDPDSQVYPIQDKGFTVREARHAGAPKYSLAKKERSDKDEFDHGKGIMFRDKIQPTTFQVGENVTFYATVVCETKETPVVTWYRDEQLLSDDYRADAYFNEETGVAKLTINNTKDYDAAVYKCVARIKDGRVSCEARLFLGDVPSRPGCPLVMQTSGQEAFLTWTPPVSDGSAYLLGYRVDIRKMGDRKWTHGPYVTEEYALLTGLEPSSSYAFRVSAHNKYGQSPFSWSSLEAKTLEPDAPKVSIATDLQPLMQFSTFDKQQMVLPAESRRPSLTVQPEAKVCEADPSETYTFSDTLSKGSFAEYRLCVSKTTNWQCVAKVVPYKKDNHDSITAEFELLRNLRQTNLITVLDGYIHADTFYVIFEKLSGINIVQYLCLHKTYKEETVARMVRQILDALQYLEHYGIVHLNLQPSSVVMATGRRPMVKLRDFTLAQKIDPDVGSPVPLAGYPDYTAPEVIKGEKVKFTADLWTLGALTFTMLSGVSPFAGNTLEETVSRILFDRYSVKEMYDNVSKESIKFVCKLMCRLPRNRPTVNKCLNSQWLSFNETMVNARNSKMFSSEKLRAFSVEYLAKRGDSNYSLAKVDIENLPKITTGPVIRPILSDRITHRLENAMKTKKKTVILPQSIESESIEVVEEGLLDKITSKIEKDIEMEEKAAVEVIEGTEQILEKEKENLVKVNPVNVSEEKITKVNTEEESEAVSRNKEEISEEMNISVTEEEKIDELKETTVDKVVARIADEKKHEIPEAQETLIDAKEISQVETIDKVETKAVTEVRAKKEEKAAVTEQELGNSLEEKVEVSETNAERKRDELVEKPDIAVLTSAVVEKEEDEEMYESADESVQETVQETINAAAGSVAKEVSLITEKDMPGEINEKLESTTIEPELYTEKESQLKAAEMMKVSDVHKQTENVKEKVEENEAEFVDAAESQEVKEKAEVIGYNNHEEGEASVSKSEISEEVQVEQSAEAHREGEASLSEEIQVKQSAETHREGEAGLCKSEVSEEVQEKESAEAIREEKASLGEEVQVKQSAETHREEEASISEEVQVSQSVETHREGETGLSKSEASEEVQEKESAEAIKEEEASLSEDVQVKQTAETHREGEASLSEEVQVLQSAEAHGEGKPGLSEISEEVQEKESEEAHREGEVSLSRSVSEEVQEKQSAETCEADDKTSKTEASEVESKSNSYGQIEQMATQLIEKVKEAALKEMAGVIKFADNLEEEDLKRCHKEQSSVTATEEHLSPEQQSTEKVITNEAVKTETLPQAGKKSETNEQVETDDSGASKQVTNNEISEEAATSDDSTVKADERLATESDSIISVESVTKTSEDMGLVTTELIKNVSQLESETSIKQSEVNISETQTKETLITLSSESSSEQSHILSDDIENKEPQTDKALQKDEEGVGRESTTAATDQLKAKSEANNELVKTDVESLDSTSQSSQDTQSRKQSKQDTGENLTQAASLADTASAMSPVIEHSVKENLDMEGVKLESEDTSKVQNETEARIQKSKEESVISKESLVEKNSNTAIAEGDEELKKDNILENKLISGSELAEEKESKMITNETLSASDAQKKESTEIVESSVSKIVERGVDVKASDVSLKEITTVSSTMEVSSEESKVETESVIGTAQEITQSASECMSVEKSEGVISITKEEKSVVKSIKEDVDGAVLELATVSQLQESVSSEHISRVSDAMEEIERQQISNSRQMETEGTASEKVTVSQTQETLSSEHISASTVEHAESVMEERILQTSHGIVKDTNTDKTVSETAEETMISESADKSEILANGIESEVDSVAQEILTYSVSVAGKLETAKVTESRETIREFVTNDDDIEEMKKELLEDSEVSSAECGKYLLGLHEEAVTGEHAEGEVKPDEEQIAKEMANRYIDDALMFC